MPKISKEQAESFWEFADKNKDGVLTVKELKSSVNQCLKDQGKPAMSDQDICGMFLEITGQGADKPITKAKYISEMCKDRESDLEQMFREYDKDGSGTLSHDEISKLAAAAGYGPDAAADIIASADANNDGVVSLGEFKKCVG